MRRRAFLVLMLSTWLLATGSPWDLVQTFAWDRMIATYSRTMPLRQAVRRTLSGEVMCGVCEVVQHARRHHDGADTALPGPKSPDRILFVSAPRALVFASPVSRCTGLVPDVSAPTSAERPLPLLPPPRAAA